MILAYKGKYPRIAPGAFIAPTATIIGDVEIAEGASIWYGTVVRGDKAPIRIGKNTNIQDNCTIHVDTDKPAIIGDHVTVGHNAVVHGCTVENSTLIGMSAVVLSGAHIKTGCVVAAGAVLKEDQVVGPHHLVAGAPAVRKRDLPPNITEKLDRPVNDYLELSRYHRQALEQQPGSKLI